MPSVGVNFTRENSPRNMTQLMQAVGSLRVKYAWPEARFKLKLLTSPRTATIAGTPDLMTVSINRVTCVTDNGSLPAHAPPPFGSRELFPHVEKTLLGHIGRSVYQSVMMMNVGQLIQNLLPAGSDT